MWLEQGEQSTKYVNLSIETCYVLKHIGNERSYAIHTTIELDVDNITAWILLDPNCDSYQVRVLLHKVSK